MQKIKKTVIFPSVDGLEELILIDGVSQGSYCDARGFHMNCLPSKCLNCQGINFIERGEYGSGGLIFTCGDCLTLYVVCDYKLRPKIVPVSVPALEIDKNLNLRPLSQYNIRMAKEPKFVY